jgi:hypothetical protein
MSFAFEQQALHKDGQSRPSFVCEFIPQSCRKLHMQHDTPQRELDITPFQEPWDYAKI